MRKKRGKGNSKVIREVIHCDKNRYISNRTIVWAIINIYKIPLKKASKRQPWLLCKANHVFFYVRGLKTDNPINFLQSCESLSRFVSVSINFTNNWLLPIIRLYNISGCDVSMLAWSYSEANSEEDSIVRSKRVAILFEIYETLAFFQ